MKIEINGKYYEANEIGSPIDSVGVLKICVLQRGNVLIGYFNQDGASCWLEKASVIRRWGTESGLGQLSNEGPTSETVLDKCSGRVDFDVLTMVFSIEVKNLEPWKNVL